MTKLSVAFRNFANSPKNVYTEIFTSYVHAHSECYNNVRPTLLLKVTLFWNVGSNAANYTLFTSSPRLAYTLREPCFTFLGVLYVDTIIITPVPYLSAMYFPILIFRLKSVQNRITLRGRAMIRAVSRRSLTVEGRVRFQTNLCGIRDGRSGKWTRQTLRREPGNTE